MLLAQGPCEGRGWEWLLWSWWGTIIFHSMKWRGAHLPANSGNGSRKVQLLDKIQFLVTSWFSLSCRQDCLVYPMNEACILLTGTATLDTSQKCTKQPASYLRWPGISKHSYLTFPPTATLLDFQNKSHQARKHQAPSETLQLSDRSDHSSFRWAVCSFMA